MTGAEINLADLVTAQLRQGSRKERTDTMPLNDIYESNSNWLKAEDIKGHQPIVTIATAEVHENDYNGDKKKQIVLTFEGRDKKLGLNFTNAAKIAELTGSEEYQDWIGVTLKLYVEKVKGPQGMVDGIRVFPELPNGKAAAAPQQFSGPATAPAPDDDIPF